MTYADILEAKHFGYSDPMVKLKRLAWDARSEYAKDILVVTGNKLQFDNFATAICGEVLNGMHPEYLGTRFIYFSGVHSIRGHRFLKVIFQGTWYERTDVDTNLIEASHYTSETETIYLS